MMIHLYMYMPSFSYFSMMVYHRIWNIAPCALHSRTLLFIHSIDNSLHLLIPNSQSLTPYPSPLATTSLLYTFKLVNSPKYAVK